MMNWKKKSFSCHSVPGNPKPGMISAASGILTIVNLFVQQACIECFARQTVKKINVVSVLELMINSRHI